MTGVLVLAVARRALSCVWVTERRHPHANISR